MDKSRVSYKRVGYLKKDVAFKLGINYTGVIYASPGVIKHIKERHGKHFKTKISESVIEIMRKIIDSPEYIGVYLESMQSPAIDFVRNVNGNILLGVKIDEKDGYIYVSTMYPITESKIEIKRNSGELIPVKQTKEEKNEKNSSYI